MTPSNTKNSKRKAKIIVLAIVALIFVSSVGYATFYLALFIPAETKITSALDTYDYVEEANWYLFQGDKNNENDAIFIYPNPRTDSKSYFYLATGLQRKGYNVFLGKSLFHQPILSTNLVNKAMDAYPAHTSWIVGSHLDGSNAVTKHLLKDASRTRAVFSMGSIPNEKSFALDIPVLILLGELDEQTEKQAQAKKIALENENVALNIIDGATDSGFAFAKQKDKDKQPNQITREAQQDATIDRLDKYIRVVSGITIN